MECIRHRPDLAKERILGIKNKVEKLLCSVPVKEKYKQS
jgi:hypothetical protein